MGEGALPAIIAALLSAGGVAFLTAAVRGIGTIRSGARASTRETMRDLADARDSAEARERASRNREAYWQRTAAGYAYQLHRAGVTPDPADPRPPDDREPDTAPAPRRRGRKPAQTEEVQP